MENIQIEINLCRVCFKNVGVLSFFTDYGEGIIAEIVTSLCNLDAIRDVNLPASVCIKCVEDMKLAVQIKSNIIKSEVKLKAYLEEFNHRENFIQLSDGKTFDSSELVDTDTEQLNSEDSPRDAEAVAVKCDDNNIEIFNNISQPNVADSDDELPLPNTYVCEKCIFTTDTYKRLLFHMRTHKDLKLFECEHCGKKFKCRSYYLTHIDVHRPYTPYKCNSCSKAFKSPHNLTQHLLIHKTEPILPCPYCDKVFCHMKGLSSHLLTHNERNVACTICGKKFKHSTFMKHHVARVHERSIKINKKLNTNTSVQIHESPCEFCGKILSSQRMAIHIKKHTKKFQCLYCDKAFGFGAQLITHMQTHVNAKDSPLDPETLQRYLKYKCDECDKAFTTSVLLNRHKTITHKDEKDHVCTYCSKKFAFKMYLEKHIRLIHDTTNPKNSICNICGKVSADASNLKLHMLAHTGETPYHCTFCASKFVYAKSLRLHISSKHKS